MEGEHTLLYIGPNNIGNMAAKAEHKLTNGTYRWEGQLCDFKTCATLHKKQHTIIVCVKNMAMQGWMKEARQGTFLEASRQ